ncbi:MAG: pilus assembly protein [Propionibacteriaceae bacterium]|nr:pilus assembly protein [Propionibacteriaceae bacterium]
MSSTRCTRDRRSRVSDERGMVTAELGMASLLLAVAVVVVAWLVAVLGLLVRCQNTAWEVARHQARGDLVAAQLATSQAPPGARIGVDRSSGRVTVLVELGARPWVDWLPAVPLSSRAVVFLEPGVT